MSTLLGVLCVIAFVVVVICAILILIARNDSLNVDISEDQSKLAPYKVEPPAFIETVGVAEETAPAGLPEEQQKAPRKKRTYKKKKDNVQ